MADPVSADDRPVAANDLNAVLVVRGHEAAQALDVPLGPFPQLRVGPGTFFSDKEAPDAVGRRVGHEFTHADGTGVEPGTADE
jgi:hypothetical protein